MKISEILQQTSHRPWEIRNHPWKYYQEWNDAVFLHWKIEAEELRKWVPDKLEIESSGGSAWVSLVAFNMEKIRPRILPSFSPISYFHEINIRTYVKLNGKTGVYFLSIEGGKWLSCKIARQLSELPYLYSKMKRSEGIYTSENNAKKSNLNLEFKVGKKLASKSETDLFLTERYALFQDVGNRLNEFEIHHLEWPIFDVEINSSNINFPQFPGFFQTQPDWVHYSPGVQVIAWDKTSYSLD